MGKNPSKIKDVNSAAQPVLGMAYRVHMSIGAWSGQWNLMVVPLDDFDVILGNDFFVAAKWR